MSLRPEDTAIRALREGVRRKAALGRICRLIAGLALLACGVAWVMTGAGH